MKGPMYPTYRMLSESRIQLPKGWTRLAVDLFHELQFLSEDELLPKEFKVLSVMEKYGTLQVACSHSMPVLDRLVEGYVSQAARTCEDCGYAFARLSRKDTGWKRVVCHACGHKSGYLPIKVDRDPPLARLTLSKAHGAPGNS